MTDVELLDSFKLLWAEVDAIWEANGNSPANALYVSADYMAIFEKLCELRGRVDTVLEWGSGLGVMTIMANRLGFGAYGIEAEPDLVKLAEGLASKYGAHPKFVVGLFIPAEFEEDYQAGEEFGRTLTTATPAYEELDMELRDFDLVYAFPWPDEHGIYRSIMQPISANGAHSMSRIITPPSRTATGTNCGGIQTIPYELILQMPNAFFEIMYCASPIRRNTGSRFCRESMREHHRSY